MLRGHTVVVTGGAKGLGRALADAFGRVNANVVITGRDGAALALAALELRAAGTSAVAVVADVTDRAAMARVVQRAEDAFGGLDVLVNNAGVRGPVGPTWEVDHDALWHAMEVNLGGTMIACRAALASMIPRGAGRIINIVSHAGAHRWPHATAYSVSKAAVIKFTENLAIELRHHSVVVLSYHPGLLDLGITIEGARAAASGGEWERRIASWVEGERAAGRITPVARATDALLRLVTSDDKGLSGRYVTVDDEI